MPTVGINGSLAITAVITTRTAGTIRRYRDLESPAARHETRRIGKAAGMAAAGSVDGRSARSRPRSWREPTAPRRRSSGLDVDDWAADRGVVPAVRSGRTPLVAGQGRPRIVDSVRCPPGWALRLSAPPGPSLVPENQTQVTSGTASLTDRVRRASRNAMKPRIQRVLTQWNPGFTTSVAAAVRRGLGGGQDVDGADGLVVAGVPPPVSGRQRLYSRRARVRHGFGHTSQVSSSNDRDNPWPGCPNSRWRCSRC